MTPEEIPQELVDLLDERAGRKHSRTGSVLTTLAEILTRYQEMLVNAPGELRIKEPHRGRNSDG